MQLGSMKSKVWEFRGGKAEEIGLGRGTLEGVMKETPEKQNFRKAPMIEVVKIDGLFGVPMRKAI